MDDDLVQHHIKYKEIHGVDEIVMMTKSKHKKLHHRLRKNNLCKIPANKLHKIATAANNRTNRFIRFRETMATGVRLSEIIRYNENTGKIGYASSFEPTNNYKLMRIDI